MALLQYGDNRSGGWWWQDAQHDRSSGSSSWDDRITGSSWHDRSSGSASWQDAGWQGGTEGEPSAAQNTSSAVAEGSVLATVPEHGTAPSTTPVFTYEYFVHRGLGPWRKNYKQHNAALKWLRQVHEHPEWPFWSPHFELPVDGVTAVAVIDHPKGMDYTFTSVMEHWHWHDMIAQLQLEDMRQVVEGPQGRSGGLVGCTFAQRPNSYDHKRHHQLRQQARSGGAQPPAAKLPVWDFVVHRQDGTAIRLHPEWSKPNVEAYDASEGHEEEVQPPRAGLGRSDGRGTYSHYKAVGCQLRFTFDTAKRP